MAYDRHPGRTIADRRIVASKRDKIATAYCCCVMCPWKSVIWESRCVTLPMLPPRVAQYVYFLAILTLTWDSLGSPASIKPVMTLCLWWQISSVQDHVRLPIHLYEKDVFHRDCNYRNSCFPGRHRPMDVASGKLPMEKTPWPCTTTTTTTTGRRWCMATDCYHYYYDSHRRKASLSHDTAHCKRPILP